MILRLITTAPPPCAPYLVDERLDAEEIGTLAYLNLLDDGAEIDTLDIGRRLQCGSFRFGRILNHLRELGYVETRRNNRRGRGSGRGAAPADFIVRDQATRSAQ